MYQLQMKSLLLAAGALTISLMPCEPVNAQNLYRSYASPGSFTGGGSSLQDTQIRNQVQTNTMNIKNMQMQQRTDSYFNRVNSINSGYTPSYRYGY